MLQIGLYYIIINSSINLIKNLILVIIIISVLTISIFLFVVMNSSNDYNLIVDPIKDPQDLFIMSRVILYNSGDQDLTNVKINFGNGNISKLDLLKSGQKVIFSPPNNASMDYVTVTTAEGITIIKQYRTLPKMPGMMGS